MAENAHVPVTREGALGALKLLMIVLAAVIVWQSASTLNTALQAQGLVTAPPFTRGLARLLIGIETTAPFQERLRMFWENNHRLIALTMVMAAITLLVTRYLLLGRVLDFMYVESFASDKRIYSGFVANIVLVLLHAGILYSVVLCGRDPRQAALTPQLLMGLFLFNAVWAMGIFVTSRSLERPDLRGLLYVALTSLLMLLLLGWTIWRLEQRPPAAPAVRDSLRIVLGAGAGILLCVADAVIQTRIYCRRVPVLQEA
jgi:hypothetical protein